MDLSSAAEPRSDQQNFDDLIAGPRTVTIAEVRQGSAEQPVEVHLVEYPGRPYKPNKSMIRVLIHAWGKESSVYAGRRLTLIGDPAVQFGGQTVGGIKIDALSNIDKPLTMGLTIKRGRRAPYVVKPLADAPAPARTDPTAAIVGAFDTLGVTVAQLEAKVGLERSQWAAADLAELAAIGKRIKAGETTAADEFGDAS